MSSMIELISKNKPLLLFFIHSVICFFRFLHFLVWSIFTSSSFFVSLLSSSLFNQRERHWMWQENLQIPFIIFHVLCMLSAWIFICPRFPLFSQVVCKKYCCTFCYRVKPLLRRKKGNVNSLNLMNVKRKGKWTATKRGHKKWRIRKEEDSWEMVLLVSFSFARTD